MAADGIEEGTPKDKAGARALVFWPLVMSVPSQGRSSPLLKASRHSRQDTTSGNAPGPDQGALDMHPGGSVVPAAGLGTRCSWSSFPLVPTPFPPPGNQVGFSLPVGPLSWPADLVLGTQAQLSRASAGCWQTNAQLNLYPPVSAGLLPSSGCPLPFLGPTGSVSSPESTETGPLLSML